MRRHPVVFCEVLLGDSRNERHSIRSARFIAFILRELVVYCVVYVFVRYRHTALSSVSIKSLTLNSPLFHDHISYTSSILFVASRMACDTFVKSTPIISAAFFCVKSSPYTRLIASACLRVNFARLTALSKSISVSQASKSPR